jgi:sulfur carrier protein ThiS
VKVEVRAFATLAVFLPSPRPGTAAVLNLPEGSTVRDMAATLGIPGEMSVVILVNGDHADAGRILNPDDVVTLFPPLVGGSHGSWRQIDGRLGCQGAPSVGAHGGQVGAPELA